MSDDTAPLTGADATPQPRNRWLHALVSVLTGLLSGSMLGVCFRPNLLTPPQLGAGIDLGLLVFVALVPLMWTIMRSRRALAAGLCGYVLGLVWFWMTCRFLLAIHEVAWWVCGPLFGIYTATMALLMRRLWRVAPGWIVLTWPALWIGGDWLWTAVGVKFPWFYLSYALIDADPMIAQTADLFGATTPTLLIVMVNVLVVRLLIRPAAADAGTSRWRANRVAIIGVGSLLIAAHVYGAIRIGTLPDSEEPGPVVALVQPNLSLGIGRAPVVSARLDRTVDILEAIESQGRVVGTITRESDRFAAMAGTDPFVRDHIWIQRNTPDRIDLLVLPETLYPWGYREVRWYDDHGYASNNQVIGTARLLAVPSRNGWHTQINSMEYDLGADLDEVDEWETLRIQNCTLLIAPDGELVCAHAKRELVPVGEYVPFGESTHIFRDLTTQISGLADPPDYKPGTQSTIFELPVNGRRIQYGVAICFETVFPDLCRQFTAAGSRMLLVQSNDAWFMKEPMDEPGQIWLGARYRAIESRVSVVRCVNSGISGVCRPDGSMLDVFNVETSPGVREQHGVPGALITRVPLGPGGSLYVRIGDVLPMSMFWLIAAMVAASFVFPLRSRRASEPAAAAPQPAVVAKGPRPPDTRKLGGDIPFTEVGSGDEHIPPSERVPQVPFDDEPPGEDDP